MAVTVKFIKKLNRPINLENIKKHKQLRHLSLIKQVTRKMLNMASQTTSENSKGGMVTKLEAAKIARMAQDLGASALLCFPPQSMSMGGSLRPEMAIEHFKRISDVTDLPLICFNYPIAGGLSYPFETLLKLFEEVTTIKAIKDWCSDPMLHEKQIRVFQNLPNPVNVLTTHSAWLMSSLVMGANGLLSGAGSVIAPLQAVSYTHLTLPTKRIV